MAFDLSFICPCKSELRQPPNADGAIGAAGNRADMLEVVMPIQRNNSDIETVWGDEVIFQFTMDDDDGGMVMVKVTDETLQDHAARQQPAQHLEPPAKLAKIFRSHIERAAARIHKDADDKPRQIIVTLADLQL